MAIAVREISCHELAALRSSHLAPALLDVRQAEEFELVHLEGATLVPLNELPERLEELRPLFEQAHGDVVVYCRSGGRSHKACEWLQAQGVENVVNLSGGINLYAKEVDTSLTAY